MAKEYYVELGGRSRLVRFTRQERVDIENRFDCDIKDFVYAKAFPLVDGKPTLGGRLECQEALIYYGLRHNGPKVTEAWVSQQLQEMIAKGGNVYKPLSEAIVGLLASGILGWNPPLEEEDEEGKEPAGDEKAQPGPHVIAPIKKTG